MKKYNVGILGATGAVGQEMMKILAERSFPIGELRLLASKNSAGKEIDGHIVVEACRENFDGLDIILGAAENDIAERFVDDIKASGAVFIVGNSNKFAHNAAVAVAHKPGSAYNPLFIYGNSGLGKTHLLLAIGQYIRENNPGAKIAYIKGDEFTNQLLKSIKEGTGEEFRMKYRNVDLFLVDDIQFIAGKQATQEEFFHTFNNIYEAGHQIVITSDRPPIEMSLLDDRLMSRFQGGLMADIQPPDIETRMVITRAKAAQLGLVLEDDAVAYIAETITSNVRQIEGVIKRLTAYREILDSTIDTAAVKRAIKDVVRIGTFIPSPQLIIRESARYFQLSEEDLRGQNRSKNTATARQISMYLIRTLTNLPLKEIGAEYGDRNHSTVLSSIRKVEEMIKEDPMYSAAIRDITSNINSQ